MVQTETRCAARWLMGFPKPIHRLWGPLALFVLSLAAQAQTRLWHVTQKDLAGIDPNDQVRTIGEAVAHLEPGDTVLLHGGTYREQVTIDGSGTSQKPITIRAAEGESVILTGADRITDWSPIPGPERVYSTPWPHKFVTWTKHYTHPNDDYHRLIGRCEQVFIHGYQLRQVLGRDKISRGTFFVDLDAQRLYIQPADNQEITNKTMVEASTRDQILRVKGNHVIVKGIRFRYAANRAQHGAAQFAGDHITIEDCLFEYTNAGGAAFAGQHTVVRRCTFQHNGQLGFGAHRAHGLRMTGCTVRNNNTSKTSGLCGSKVLESRQLSCCDVYSQGLLNGLDWIEAALFERGEDAHEDRLG